MRPAIARAAHLGLVLVVMTATVEVAGQDVTRVTREVARIEADLQTLLNDRLEARDLRSPTHVEERLTDGELFYRLQDYVRASIIFSDIVEHYPDHRAYPDALFLLGDSLYRAGDHLGARTRFREIIRRSAAQQFRPYAQRALGRLIEIAIHTRDFEGVEEYFQQLSQLPPSEIEAATAYYRAKYLYNLAVPAEEIVSGTSGPTPVVNLAILENARVGFEGVQQGSPYYPQARYFIGVVHTLRSEFPQAIEAFRRVLRAPVETLEHESVTELTQLSLGRLCYETDQLDQAIEAYQAIPRTSSRFDTALYEIAWVYIRQGDSTRAERALEVLAIATPDSKYIPDAKLLRGNLLMRNGRLDDAETVFREVQEQFGPVRRELDDVLAAHADAGAYFRELVRNNMAAFDANSILPESARRYTSLESEMERALRVLSDLNQARTLVNETTDLVLRLNGALAVPNPANVFPDLRRHHRRATALRNRITRVRRELIRAESADGPRATGRLGSVRERRQRLEAMLGRMPVNDEDFDARDDQMIVRYRRLQRELSNLKVELLGMDARIVATERFLADTASQGQPNPGAAAIQAELAQHREAIQHHREQIVELERAIEIARLQVGVGDRRYEREVSLRAEYAELIDEERALMGSAGGRTSDEIDSLLERVSSIEEELDAHDARVDDVALERAANMRIVINEESRNLEGYRVALARLEGETEIVVGGITHQSFRRVRERFYDLVLRSDVGEIDVSWQRREEHRTRVDMLTRERAREIQVLDDEFREIMDQEGDSPAGPTP